MFCSFCNNEVRKGEGVTFVYKDGTSLNFCSSKCRKNMLNLGREGRLQKWTNKSVALVHEKKAEKKETAFSKDIEEKLAKKAAATGEKK